MQNIMYPQLGAAGSHYARTVAPLYRQQVNLPDPSVIFDREYRYEGNMAYQKLKCGTVLMARNGPVKEHPAKVSSSLFHFATIIIHGKQASRDPA